MKQKAFLPVPRPNPATISASLALLAICLLASCATPKPPLHTVARVDLDRYMGRWNVIANIPYSLERGKVASYDTYAPRLDGRMQNNFTFRRGSLTAPEVTWHGVGWVVDPKSNAEWRVRFIWPFTAVYLIIDLDPDYQWAVIGHPSRNLFWILARDTSLPDATYAGILQRAAAQGYDTNRVVKVLQPPH
ncbi:MAG: lipocalin family protein [Verrucomicrobiae bacterium]|nr:lipocalin family protein [Verrucomicrobiae bacterium]